MQMGTNTDAESACKVLVVDDSDVIRESCRAVLESAGYDVTVTDNPISVPFLLWKVKPQLVLLDVQMPGVTGDRLMEIVLDGKADLDCKVCLFSSEPEDDLKGICRRLPLSGYYRKNEGLTHLVDFVRRIMAE